MRFFLCFLWLDLSHNYPLLMQLSLVYFNLLTCSELLFSVSLVVWLFGNCKSSFSWKKQYPQLVALVSVWNCAILWSGWCWQLSSGDLMSIISSDSYISATNWLFWRSTKVWVFWVPAVLSALAGSCATTSLRSQFSKSFWMHLRPVLQKPLLVGCAGGDFSDSELPSGSSQP